MQSITIINVTTSKYVRICTDSIIHCGISCSVCVQCRMYELTTVLPLHNNLKITVMDHDVLSADDEIGETVIDLENRYLTRHRAICGIPESYSRYYVYVHISTYNCIIHMYSKFVVSTVVYGTLNLPI